MKTRLILLAVVSMVVTLSVAAEPTDAKNRFRSLDSDNNGYLSIGESAQRSDLLLKWETTDKNADGKLESSEFSAFEEEPARDFVPIEREN